MMKLTHTRAMITLGICLTMTLAACADETKVENHPVRVEAKNLLEPRGPLAAVHAAAEMQPVQRDRAAGIVATVTIANRGTDLVEIVNPALTTKMELAANGRKLEVVPAGPTVDSDVAKIVTIRSGEVHRFDVAIREVYERPPAPASASKPAPRRTPEGELPETGTMSSLPEGAERDALRAQQVRIEPLAAGDYSVRLRIGLLQPPDVEDRALRYLMTDPVTVSYATK